MLVRDIRELLGRRMAVSFRGPENVRISGLSYHSAHVTHGDLFAALPGSKDNGARYISEALKRGARMILFKEGAAAEISFRQDTVAYLEVEDVRLALSMISDSFYGSPSRELTVIGITGTNGKTTLSYLVESIARAAGLPCGVIGTIEYRLGSDVIPAERTTPEAPDLQRIFRWMVDKGAEMVVMEVSSHALAQDRVSGTCFDYGVFTNLSLDHLDFHGDMEHYFAAKKRLFTDFQLKGSIINMDNPWGRRLAEEVGGEIITFGHQTDCLIRPGEISSNDHGLRMSLEVPGAMMKLFSPLIGRHNQQNIMAAASIGWRVGFPREAIVDGLASMREVPGRFQKVSAFGEPLVIVDYAHTPDALENLLESARDLTSGKIILVFGCGGDRDRRKRPIMGSVAAEKADLTFITSDNPRSERPDSIIESIEEGYRTVRENSYLIVPDRREAIFQSIGKATSDDMVIIAGKGHEDYQLIGPKKIHFDDREMASMALRKKRGMKR